MNKVLDLFLYRFYLNHVICLTGGEYLRSLKGTNWVQAVAMVFENLKTELLSASDLELHYAALVVFNELSTRRLGGKMGMDASGNALVVVDSPPRKNVRSKTPKKVTPKQDAIDDMFAATLVFGDPIELPADALFPTAPPMDSQESHASVSPEPTSDPRPIPATKKGGKAKSRE
jgi:hypothetical protein